jgi:hypothetical protein
MPDAWQHGGSRHGKRPGFAENWQKYEQPYTNRHMHKKTATYCCGFL